MPEVVIYGNTWTAEPLVEGFSWKYQEFTDQYGERRWYATQITDDGPEYSLTRRIYYLRTGYRKVLVLTHPEMVKFEQLYVPTRGWHEKAIAGNTTIRFTNGVFAISDTHIVLYGMASGGDTSKEFDNYEAAFKFYKELTFENMVYDWAKLSDGHTIIRKCRK